MKMYVLLFFKKCQSQWLRSQPTSGDIYLTRPRFHFPLCLLSRTFFFPFCSFEIQIWVKISHGKTDRRIDRKKGIKQDQRKHTSVLQDLLSEEKRSGNKGFVWYCKAQKKRNL